MATYYHDAPEIQPDGLQTLYLMNPTYSNYAESSTQANMIFLNSGVNNSQNPINLAPTVGIPINFAGQESVIRRTIHDVSSSTVQGPLDRFHCNHQWTRPTENTSASVSNFSAQQQALSLRLSPYDTVSVMETTAVDLGADRVQSFLLGSKFLKAAQGLLDEVVNVGKGVKDEKLKSCGDSEGTAADTEKESSGKRISAELSTVERQELQNKKAKLVNMLDEIEQRYRQYHHQIQIVISSFEAIAGPGSARTYTALASKTISKQFRCLGDAITRQIQATSRSLGEEDTKSPVSRLRFVDRHLRQQRALQQIGIIQHSAWRPQRGLPERSVSILRAWLFEHFLHPYPKDSDKIMLAKQTGLTRSQVSNWFINARVRLWKPMVEEMYLEETKDQEQNNCNTENSGKSQGSEQQQINRTIDDPKSDQGQASTSLQSKFMASDQNQTIINPSPKRTRTTETHSRSIDAKPEEPPSNRELLMKFMDVREQSYSLVPNDIGHGGNYGAYTIGEIGRFDTGHFAPRYASNGVSLTLGLPHCENISITEAQGSFVSNASIQPLVKRIELDMSSEAIDFCSLNNNANSAQLLPDYVT